MGEEWKTVVEKRRKKEKREKSVMGEKRWAHKKGKKEKETRKGERKRKEGEAEKGGSEKVKKDVTDWTVVSRSKKQKKMIQIYVKVNGGKLVPTEVNLMNDTVEDVVRHFPNSEDVYVTLHGKVLKRSERLKNCGVTDGCTVHVTNRLRGGGRNKSKTPGGGKKKSPMKVEQNDQGTREKSSPEVDEVVEMFDRSSRMEVGGWSAESMEAMLGMDDEQTERMLRMLRSNVAEELGGDPEVMIGGIRKFMQERRQREKEQRRREELSEEMRAESTDEPEVTSRVVEVKTGRGSASLVQGKVDGHDELDETHGKGKGKGNGGKGEHGGKGDKGGKGFQQSTRTMKR